MVNEYTLRILPEDAADGQTLKRCICRQKSLSLDEVKGIQVVKRSIDARQSTIYLQMQVRVFIGEEPKVEDIEPILYQDVSTKPQVIVVGAGPAGLFASLRLIELGCRPILVERGKNVSERKRDIAASIRTHHIRPESNYCYGEGGAGAFSDGKLYTRSKKRGNVNRILGIFHQFGASDSIMTDAHPHIGTDRLPRIISGMREQIIASGGEVHFETQMTDLLIEGRKVRGIRCRDGQEFSGPVILATGHSARDVYRLIFQKGLPIESKGFAMGVRLEHPQTIIDQLMYHNRHGRGKYLPAAEYNFVQQVDGRGVYSFCMCPGGFIVPAGERDGVLVVNGMSPSNRGSKWANSGMVVEIRPDDLPKYEDFIRNAQSAIPGLAQEMDADRPDKNKVPEWMRMLHLQLAYEYWTFHQIEKGLVAPAQRMVDFVQGKISQDLTSTSYIPGIQSSPLHEWMPYEMRYRLQQGFRLFDRSIHGFLCQDAQLIAPETRTSSPVRLPRNPERLVLLEYEGIYPCGEGAGYAGGIVSSAIDGELCAEKAAENLLSNH